MLKISSISFIDKKGKSLFINGRDLESFPLVGGEEANMVNTKVYNQHGNTFVQSFMESYQGEIIFVIPYFSKTDQEMLEKRKSITSICNPLNGIVTMKIVLNTGEIYNRDITFTTAPIFPTGFENRNEKWQKVQLLYEANDPFWYDEETIVETFYNVSPLFNFPFTMSSDSNFMMLNFQNKIYNSTLENPNLFRFRTGNTILFPQDYDYEASQSLIDMIKTKDDLYTQININTEGHTPQALFSFDIISSLEKKYGTDIWNGATELDDKISRAKLLITEITYRVTALGKTPTGNKMIMSRWNHETESWNGAYAYTDAIFIPKYITSTSISSNIDSLGFAHMLIYTDPSDGTIGNCYIRIDTASADVVISNSANKEPVYFGNVLPSKTAINEGQVDSPVIIKIVGSCSNPLIENKTTGEFIKFKNLTMSATDELLIDTTFGQKKVELNGQNIFNKLDYSSTFFNLINGDNEIDFSDETGSNAATIHFIYKNLYITI